MPNRDNTANPTFRANAAANPAAPNRQARRRARRAARSTWLARRRPRLSRLLAWLLSAVLGSLGLAHAQLNVNTLPQGGRVVVGTGQLIQGSNTLLISQSSARLGLDWQSFSIGANALVEFQQPDRSSVALNRVLGNDPSEIYGRLKANGQVFLVNPNGVLFARGAKVDVGGLVASTLDLAQQDFADGRYLFGATSTLGRVVNQGELRASAGGYLALFGRDVDNQGSIQVDAGSVVLASGRAATVSISGNGLISAVVTPGASGSVLNSGSIEADGGRVTLTAASAEGLAASLVNNSGIVRANTLVDRGGEIWITGDDVSNSGTVQARAEGGGDGGRILLLANAARGTAQVSGNLDASSAQGQGGFIETSGSRVNVAEGTRVSTQAPAGRSGTWLIDPNDYTVAASGGNITGATLSTNLGLGNVSIATATQGTAGGNGDIFVNDTVTWAANRLTLTAERNILINSAIGGNGSGQLSLEYGQATTTGTGASYSINAPVSLGANGAFSTKLGSSGSTINYTLITAVAGLTAIEANTAALAGNYALASSLDLTGLTFSPIGNETTSGLSTANSFGGRFEGLGQTITGLSFNPVGTSSAGGLFATTSGATISNLRLANFSLNGGFATGTLAGAAGNTAIRNVAATGTVQSSVNSYVGGLVGRTQTGGSISGSSANVTTSSSNNGSYVGGLAGESVGTIASSSASGSVSGGARTGGLVGSYVGSSVDGSQASGNVTSTAGSADVGGLLGYAASTGTLSNSSATGNVSGATNANTVGGLVGQFQMTGGISNVTAGAAGSSVSGGTYVGGVLGYTNNTSTTSFVTSAGNNTQFAFLGSAVTGTTWVGGLVGHSASTATFSGVSSDGVTVSLNRSTTNTGGAGGVAGYLAGAVSSSSSSNTVRATGVAGGTIYLGGLIGQAAGGTNYSISASAASGTVTGNYASNSGGGYAGGLVGQINVGANVVSVTGSTATGAVSGTSTAGGLVGYADGAGSISSSSASGNVTGTNVNTGSVGGLVGEFRMSGGMSAVSAAGTVSTATNAGGLAGYTNTAGTIGAGSTVTAASVSGGTWVGGVIGQAAGAGAIDGFVVATPVTATGNAGGVAGYSAGQIRNSRSTGTVQVGSGSYGGGLAGQADGGISNSTSASDVTGAGGSSAIGGLVGYLNGGTITGSSAAGNVTFAASGNFAGGLVGWAGSAANSINSSSATGQVSGGIYSGGLVGYFNPTAGSINNSFASGNVSTTFNGGDVGGLLGFAASTGSLTNSYATGNVTAASGSDSVGGLVGQFQMTGGISNVTAGAAANGNTAATTVSGGNYTGGVIGWTNNTSTTSFVHNPGAGSPFAFLGSAVSGNTWVGGLVGQSTGTATFSNVTSSAAVSTNRSTTSGAGGIAGYVAGAVSNASATGSVSATGTGTGQVYLGGLIGQAAGSSAYTISNSTATGNVTGNYTSSSGGGYAGGLIGQINVSTNAVSVTGSSASGTVSGASTVGGLVGYADGTGSITSSSATGSVSGTNNNTGSAGGLVGEFRMAGGMSAVSAAGAVSTAFHAGGLAGYANTAGTIGGGNVASTATGASVSGGSNVGGVIGYSQGTGTITGFTTSMSVTGAAVTNPQAVGGIVGRAVGQVSNSSSSSNVSGQANTNVGGLVGWSEGGGIADSSATGTVTQSGNNASVGGLVGYVNGAGSILRSTASGNVSSSGTDPNVGGLVGGFQSTGSISNSSATGNVSGGANAGGLVGYFTTGTGIFSSTASGNVAPSNTSPNAGGLVGYAQGTGGITSSSATGTVTTSSTSGSIGGAVGQYLMTGTLSGLSAASDVIGGGNVGGVIGYFNVGSVALSAGAISVVPPTTGTRTVSGSTWVGGLIGYSASGGAINGLSFTGNVSATTGTGAAGGLVGRTGGAVSNSSSAGQVSGPYNVGGLVGQADGAGGFSGNTSSASVSNPGTSGNVGGLVGHYSNTGPMSGNTNVTTATGSVTGGARVGGLVGYYTGGGNLSDVSASGAVNGDLYVGGLVGDFVSSGNITGATASGNVTGRDTAGGLVGSFYFSGTGSLLQANGNVTSTAGYAGGLFGLLQYSGTMSDSVARGRVSGFHHAGGAVGYVYSNGTLSNVVASGNVTANSTGNTTYIGGLVGEANYTNITLSRASGNVTAVTNSTVYGGGLIGYHYNSNAGATIDNSSASGNVLIDSGGAYVGGLIGYSGYGAVSQVTATGSVTATDSRNSNGSQWAGGLIGYSGGVQGISDATATGNVSGTYITGGLVGEFSQNATIVNASASGNVSGGTFAGGLVGYGSSISVQTSVASGNVTPGGNRDYAGGLIGYAALNNGQSISDSRATGSVLGGASYAGGLVGYLTDRNTTTQGPTVSGSTASGAVNARFSGGGLVGLWTWSTSASANRATRSLSNSSASGNVAGGTYSGGLVGSFSSYGGIQGSFATGQVTAQGSGTSSYYAGGLVGQFSNLGTLTTASTGQISNSYATGNVNTGAITLSSFSEGNLGGLVGFNDGPTASFVNIRDSYATGSVTQTNTTGRLRTGGLAGFTDSGLTNVYATGAVTGPALNTSSGVGGLVGLAGTGATATASFWATDTSGRTTSALGTAKTLAELKTASTFTGWDLATAGGSTATWRLYEGLATPLLRSFLTPLSVTLADITKAYDGTSSLGSGAITIGTTGVLNPERILVGNIPVDVGTYALTSSNLYSVQNGYDLALAGQSNLTITGRQLTFAGLVADKVYDGTRSATLLNSPQLGGLVAGEDLVFQPGSGFSALFDTKTAGLNKSVSLSGSFTLADGVRGKASNYVAPSTLSTTATITQAPVTAGTFQAVNRVYDGTTTVQVVATSGAVTGVIGTDQVTVDISGASTGTMADKNVGTAKPVTINGVVLTGADAANYVVAGAGTATVDITQRMVTVNGLQATDRNYNRNTSVSVSGTSAVLNGTVTGDSVQLTTTSLSGQMADKNVGNGKAVTVSGLGLRGLDAGNYTVQQGAVSVNITPYPLSISLGRTSTTDRLYDGTTTASTQFFQTWFSGDNITVSAGSIGYGDKNVAYNSSGAPTSKTITASGLAIGGTDAGNYALQSTTATTSGTITPKPLTVSGVSAVDRVYDGTRDVSVNIAGATVDTTAVIQGDDVAVATPGSGTVTGTVANKNVGTAKAVTVPGLGLTGVDAGNYTITGSGSGVTVNITPKPLTAVYTGVDKVYDSRTDASVIVTSADIIGADQVFFYADRNYCTGCWTFYTDRNVGTGKTINISFNGMYGTDAGNYNLLNTTGTTTAGITPKPVTLRFTAPSKVYDGTTDATVTLNAGSSGIFSVDAITTTQTAVFTDSKNVGSGKPIAVSNIVASGSGAGNYTFGNTTATTTGNVTAKPVTVSGITGVDRAYDGTTAVAVVAGTVGSSGFVAGDNVSITLPVGGLSTGTIANKNVGTNKPVTVTGLGLSGADAANYSIDSAASGITVNITPAQLTPTYVGVDRVYNGGVAAQVTSTTSGVLAGDTVTFSQTAVFTGLGAKDAGTNKPISVTNIALGGSSAANYSLLTTTASTTGSITPKPVSVSFVGGSRVYNGLADVSASVIGTSLQFVSGDDVSTTQTAVFTGDGAVGTSKAVNISNIGLAGAQAANYSLLTTTASTTASITPRPLSVSGITATNRLYDGTTVVAVDVSRATVDTTAVIAGDDVSPVIPGGSISTGTIADRNAGNSKPVSITGITLAGAQASNYALVGATGLVVNIAPKPITAAYAVASKVYDASADATVLGSSTDFLSIDNGLVSVSAQGTFTAGKNVGTGKEVAITGGFLAGGARDNYVLLNATGSATADITPRPLTVSYTGGTRVYDGGILAPVTGALSGRLSNDLVGVAQTAEFTGPDARNVGTGKPIAVSNVFLTGSDAGNYSLGGLTGTPTGTVTPKPITVTGLNLVTAVDRVYNGSTQVDVSVPVGVTLAPVSSDIVAGDQVQIGVPGSGLTTGTMNDKNAGTGKAVSVTGLTLAGADAANYRIAGTAGITVNIAPLALTATWAGVNRVYDGSLFASAIGSSAEVLAGDSLVIRGTGVFTDNKNVGTAKPVSITSGSLSGNDARNYSLSNATGTTTADVTPRAVTPSYSGGSRVYDGGVAAPVTNTTGGFIAGDQVSLTQDAVFTGGNAKNAGTNKPILVSNVALDGADAGNYTLLAGSTTTTGTITPKPLTLLGLSGLTAQNRVYDGTRDVQITVNGTGTLSIDQADLIPGDVVGVNSIGGTSTTGTVANKNVGVAKPVTVTGLTLSGADAANYSIAATQGLTVTITPLDLSATWAAANRVYDGTTAASVTGGSTSVISGDSVGFSATGVFTDGKNVGLGKAVAVTAGRITGADAGNYTLLNPTGSATADVTPRSVTANYTGGTRVYDGTLAAPVSGTLGNLVTGDVVTLAQTAAFTGDKNVGTGKTISITAITLGGADAANYSLADNTASTTGSITPRPLRLVGLTGVTADSREYDGTRNVVVHVATTGTVTADPADLIAGDDVSVVAPPSGDTTGTVATKDVGVAKPVAVAGLGLTGADAGNYSVASTSGVTVDITPRHLNATYTGVNRVYDATTDATVTASSARLVAGDAVTISASGSFTDGKNAGTAKPIAVTAGALTGADAGNYVLDNPTGSASADVTPRQVTASYTGGSRVYDGTAAAPVTRVLTGLINGDTVTASETAVFSGGTAAKNVGTGKAITVSGITLAGADAVNYSLLANTASTTGSITPRALTVSGLSGITAQNRVYDGTTSVTLNVPGALGSASGDALAGDDVRVEIGGGGIGAGTMLDKNVGQGKAVVLSGLTLAGADAGNYFIAGTTGLTVDITPKLLNPVFSAASKVYDGTADATVLGGSGDIVGGDSVSITGTGAYTGTGAKNVGTGKAISITGVALTGVDAPNYTLAATSGSTTGDITPRQLTASYTGGTRIYDGTDAAPVTRSVAGLVTGDDVALTETAIFTGAGARNVGTGKAIAVSGITLSGNDAANYSLLGSTASTTGGITPRPLTVTGITGITAQDRMYDGTTTVAVNLPNSISGLAADVIPGDDVTVTVGSGGVTGAAMLDKNVGQAKPVVLQGLALAGADAGNYLIGGTLGLTVNITPRPLTITGVTATDRAYDGTTSVAINTAGGTLSGALAGDDVQLPTTGVSGTMADKHVGTGKAVTVSGLTLAGTDIGNYTVSGGTGLTVNITPRPLTATAQVANKVYDGDTGATVTLLDDRVTGDSLSLTGSGAFATRNAGNGLAVSVGNLVLSGTDAGNYQLTTTTLNAAADITPRGVTITANDASKVYGDTLSAGAAGFSLGGLGLVAGETIGSVTLNSAGAAATASVTGGPYTLTPSAATGGTFDPANYSLTYRSGLLTVVPRAVTISVGSQQLTAGTDEAGRVVTWPGSFSVTTSDGGLVGSDRLAQVAVDVVGQTGTAARVGQYELRPSGGAFTSGSASNYTLTYQSGALLVLPQATGQVLAVQLDPAELERAERELDRLASSLSRRRVIELITRLRTDPQGVRAELSASDLALMLAAQERRVTPGDLLKLPLYSVDPELRRLMQQPSETTTP